MASADETSDIFCLDILLETPELIRYALAYVELEIASAWSLEFRVWPGRHRYLVTIKTTTLWRLTVL
jgi:hypothetical protein